MVDTRIIQDISQSGFRKYGRVIEYPNIEKKGDKRNLWKIVYNSLDKTGWRVAYLVLRHKTIGRLECHPNSDETLEPLRGKALIVVSEKEDLSSVRVFYLNKPVVLYKGIWHGLISLSEEAHIKIVENLKVSCKYFKLQKRWGKEEWM